MTAQTSDALRLTCAACGQANRVPAAKLAAGPKCGVCGAALADGRVQELDPAAHDKMIRDDLPVLVDYWAPWCGPCRAMAPAFAQAAQALEPHARLLKLDTEAVPEIAQRYQIRSIPTLILFSGGREVARQAGAISAPAIVNWVRSVS